MNGNSVRGTRAKIRSGAKPREEIVRDSIDVGDLNAFFKRMPVAFYRSALNGELVAANPALATLLGYGTVDELKSEVASVESVYVSPERRLRWIEEIGATGVVYDFDIELRRPDGTTIWARDSARAIRDEAGEVMFYEGSLVDVTDKIEAQKAKDEFIATVSHELRNPIAAMLGLGQELANNYDSFTDEDRREMAQMIARQADDASWLIEDLLVAYGDDLNGVSVHPEVFDVVKEIERVLEVEDHPIDLQVFDASSQVRADPRRTRQILKNLVSNALRHGGPTVSVALTKVGDRIEVKIRDSGVAISDSDVERIFKAFEMGSRGAHPNSVGLGLTVARRLARLMGGDLTYRYEDGWSSFVLSVPTA
ncbi:MAG TPA: PAS domain-containing sensor histidine kinase [Acidimicrobiia bacterium]|nr:PAS domain-containing sensor histidine kinase [Acidimicrobiia bacterium]